MKAILCLLLLAVTASPAFPEIQHESMDHCQDCDMHRPGIGAMDRMGEMMGMCLDHADKIGLTPEQVKKLTPVHREMQKRHIRFKAELKVAEMDQMEIMEIRDFDLSKAAAAVKKSADIKTAHQLDMLKSMKEARTIMTDEQFRKMKQMMPMKMGGEMPGRKMEHREHRH